MDLELEKTLTKKLQKRLRPTWHELRYDEIRHRPYLIGKERDTDEMKTLSLFSCRKSVNFKELQNVIVNSPSQSGVTLVIHSDDSTNLFYRCQMGLNSPMTQVQGASESVEINCEVSSDDSEI